MSKRIVIQLRVNAEEKASMVEAADEEGMSLSAWIRWVCRKAAAHEGVLIYQKGGRKS